MTYIITTIRTALIGAVTLVACAPTDQSPETPPPPRVLMTEAVFSERIVGNTIRNKPQTRGNKFYFGPDGRYVLAGFAGLNDSLLSIQGGTYEFADGTVCMKREWRDGGQDTGCLTLQTVGDGIRCTIKWNGHSKLHVFTCTIGEGPHPVIAEALDRR
jgi:hypothetical protein